MIKEHFKYIGYGADEDGNCYSRWESYHEKGTRGSKSRLIDTWKKITKQIVESNRTKGYFIEIISIKREDGHRCSTTASRFIWECFNGMIDSKLEIDHKNRCSTDNRLDNLRLLTSSEQKYNSRKRKGTSSRFKGVYWDKRSEKWSARCNKNGKCKWLGYFISEEEASIAYKDYRRNNK